MKWRTVGPLFAFLAIISCVNAGDDDVLDLSSNSVDSFKSSIAQYDAILIEFCEYTDIHNTDAMTKLTDIFNNSCPMVWSLQEIGSRVF